jgi:hypothetical protein
MKLWIGNVSPGTTDEEIVAFVKKYAPTIECGSVQRVDGDGSRPAVILEFPDASGAAVQTAANRLHGMYWKERQLVAQTIVR